MNKLRQFCVSVLSAAAIIMLVSVGTSQAQPGPSFSAGYDYFPYTQLDNPDTTGGNAYLDTAEIRTRSMNFTAAYPLVFAEGRTVLVNELSYRNVILEYQGFQPGDTNPDDLHALEYNATLTHQLSDRWSLMTIATPGIASDFHGSIGSDDLTFQAVAVFIRAHSERLQIGYGAAWSNTFGQPYPFPILAIQWNNGSNMRVSSILPANFEAWYAPSQRLELGLMLNVDGNRYHGDRDVYGVDNPLVSYSVGTVGPAVNFHIDEGMSLGLNAGRTITRSFEFFDGSKDVSDIGMKNSYFLKAQLQIEL